MHLSLVEAYERLFEKGTIIDGVLEEHRYSNSKYKIAWFLKEAYTSEIEVEGFHIKEHYAQPDAYKNFFKNTATPTWHPIIYCSYGILNGFLKWSQMSYIRNQPEMCNVVNEIAIINANKYPSKTGTYTLYKNLNEGFVKCKSIIEAQIEALDPQIHIFCSTFYLYKDHFGLTEKHQIRLGNEYEKCGIWRKDGRLFLDVYHPANRTQKRDKYVNQVVSAVEYWSQHQYNTATLNASTQ